MLDSACSAVAGRAYSRVTPARQTGARVGRRAVRFRTLSSFSDGGLFSRSSLATIQMARRRRRAKTRSASLTDAPTRASELRRNHSRKSRHECSRSNAANGPSPPDCQIVGNDLATQTAQALQNVASALEAAGATKSDVVRLAIHVVSGHPLQEAFAASQRVWGQHPCAMTVLVVAGLANPAFLIEIEAMAAVAA